MRIRPAPRPRTPRPLVLALSALAIVACAPGAQVEPAPAPAEAEQEPVSESAITHTIIPTPALLEYTGGAPFTLGAETAVGVQAGDADVEWVGEYLADLLRPSTGFPIPVSSADAAPAQGSIRLHLGAEEGLGDEGYRMEVTADAIDIRAVTPAGLFRGVQTLRHLLPPEIEAEMNGPLREQDVTIPALTIVDEPRFAWRGAMLDVARHFFTVNEVKEYIDALALYKINVLHLHLSDDQGWRIEIRSRPRLAEIGGSTEVGGGPGGYYMQEEYSEIVRYARSRFMTVVPEIDLPGHTNAALVAFPELSCGTRPPALYTGTDVGFSTVCVENPETYELIRDVLGELAELTPGNFLHIGGDEVEALTDEEYALFVERVQQIVTDLGKRAVGWDEITKADLAPTTLVQHWAGESVTGALRQGSKIIASPASRAYLDMKYDEDTELGLTWAALIEVRDAYDWDPATFLEGLRESDIAGVEAPLWTETIDNITAAQYMAFPRLPAIAEIGWSPQANRSWEDFRERLAAQAPRWRMLGINYYRAPQIDWQ